MKENNKYYDDWDDEDDGLPRIISVAEFLGNPSKLPEEVIESVVRQGHKMMISGASKSGKSFLLIELAIALAEGTKWLGFQCRKSKVMYINLEIDRNSLIHRFIDIYEVLGIKPKNAHSISIWNLRGSSKPLDELIQELIQKATLQGADVIILDPIYKVMMGDENNATDMANLTNLFDKICYETGCTFVYSHHHSKGAQGFKKSMDRASGSGVFARDADAQVDMIQLNLVEVPLKHKSDDSATAWRLESSLREFRSFQPVNIWFEYPIHRVDEAGKLKKNYADGDPRANLTRSYKRNQTTDSRKEEFDKAFDTNKRKDGTCFAFVLAEYLGIAERTVRDRVIEFSDEYVTKKGIISRKK
ncbi:MAG: helicase RepA family protein [Acholeplasma sp.]|nr:helicase RepA family protein [Acholeplasma sp.]